MDFHYTTDQQDLAALASKIFSSYTPDAARQLLDGGGPVHSQALWDQLARAGILGLPFDKGLGGGGGSLFDLGIVFREAGRVVAPTTFGSTVLAGLLVDRLGSSDQKNQYLTRLCAGQLIGTVALAEKYVHSELSLMGTTAFRTGDGWLLNGVKEYVANAEIADLILVAALVEQSLGERSLKFFAIPTVSAGVTVSRHATFGQDTQNRVQLDSVHLPEDALLGSLGTEGAGELWKTCVELTTALQNMEILGGAERVLEDSAAYVSTRQQFGRPIGSFQAVQHIIANMAIAVAGGSGVAHQAMWLVAQGMPARAEVAIANSWLSKAFVDVTVSAHQIHGGMGFVRESSLYLWSQRAKVLEIQQGNRPQQLGTIADEIFP